MICDERSFICNFAINTGLNTEILLATLLEIDFNFSLAKIYLQDVAPIKVAANFGKLPFTAHTGNNWLKVCELLSI